MSYGPVSLSNVTTSDLVAPGMPVFVALNQTGNSIIKATVAIPVMDSDGSNLTGLTKLTIVTAVMTGGVNPFESKGMAEILAMSGVQKVDVTLVPADAGQEKTVDVAVMNLGGVQAFAAACAD